MSLVEGWVASLKEGLASILGSTLRVASLRTSSWILYLEWGEEALDRFLRQDQESNLKSRVGLGLELGLGV